MVTFIASVVFAVLVSFLCSLTEAALYAVPWSAIEKARRAGRPVGELLFAMRSEVDKPIAVILTCNTIANTAGAAVAGSAFTAVFGDTWLALFAALFTVLILAFGEIVPKTLGVAYASPIMEVLARPLALAIKLLTPLLWLTTLLTRLLTPAAKGPEISEDDIRAVTSLSREAGQIQPYEEKFIRNVLALDQKRVHEIMTPRTVVFSLPDDCTVEEAYNNPQTWHISRIPVWGEDNEDLVGLVERRLLGLAMRGGKGAQPLSSIMQPLHFILENQTLDVLLRELLAAHVHLFAVLDEYGGLAGVVTLEDVMEEILGSEIIDESDNVDDLREMARKRRASLAGRATEADAPAAGAAASEVRQAGQAADCAGNHKDS